MPQRGKTAQVEGYAARCSSAGPAKSSRLLSESRMMKLAALQGWCVNVRTKTTPSA
jgi:hypothetical protein